MNKRRKPNRYSDNNMNRKKEEQMQKPRMRHFYLFQTTELEIQVSRAVCSFQVWE
jgi:hypothetical protein